MQITIKTSSQASENALLRGATRAAVKAALRVLLVLPLGCMPVQAQVAVSSCGELGTPFGD